MQLECTHPKSKGATRCITCSNKSRAREGIPASWKVIDSTHGCPHVRTRGAKRCRECARAARSRPEVERFWSHVDKSGDCWLWTGTLNKTRGYGTWTITWGTTVYVHRYSYELANGPIPTGYQIDHLCKVRNCVRPDHLEAVTGQENHWRQFQRLEPKTHCKHGHPFDETNTRIAKNGARVCLTCQKATMAAFKARQRDPHELLSPLNA